MKLRIFPILASVIVTSAVLFGGWFAYDSYAMKNPLSDLVGGIHGVEHAEFALSSDQVVVKLRLLPDASLREIRHTIVTNGAAIIGKRSIQLQVENDSSAKLEQWWSKALFNVAEAMETRQYSQIPGLLEELSGQFESGGLKAETEMDDQNVYIRLTDGKTSKFVILPRVPAKLGVWPNEQIQ